MIDLRNFRDDDSPRLFRWRREPEVDRWMYQHPPEAMPAHDAWFAGRRADPGYRGLIVLQDGEPCGALTLEGLSGAQRRAKLGWYIGEAAARGRGAGRAAQALGVDLAFREHGVDKVWSEVLAENETALKAQAACGFRREGYLRRHMFKGGLYRDVVLTAILQEEWAAGRARVLSELSASGLISHGQPGCPPA